MAGEALDGAGNSWIVEKEGMAMVSEVRNITHWGKVPCATTLRRNQMYELIAHVLVGEG